MSAKATIARLAPGQVRIVLRESGAGVASFVGFVVAVAAAVYALTPAARAQPAPLGAVVAIALVWAGIARAAREEYLVDRTTRSLIARHVWLFGRGEEHVTEREVAMVRLASGGPDDDRRLVELVGPDQAVRLRVPRRVNTLTENDQQAIGQLLAEHLAVPLQAG